MLCPNCKTKELTADGDNVRCPVCGLFRDDGGEYRTLSIGDGVDGGAVGDAGSTDSQGDGPAESGPVVRPRGDAPDGNGSDASEGTPSGEADTERPCEEQQDGVTLEIEGLGNRGCRRD